MPEELNFSDDYIAKLLAKDVKLAATRYPWESQLPKRATNNAPKPNTRFLKSIIKETDSHNAALRAREVQEARARLRKVTNTQKLADEDDGRLDRHDQDHPSKRRRWTRDDEYEPYSARSKEHRERPVVRRRSSREDRDLKEIDSGDHESRRSSHRRDHKDSDSRDRTNRIADSRSNSPKRLRRPSDGSSHKTEHRTRHREAEHEYRRRSRRSPGIPIDRTSECEAKKDSRRVRETSNSDSDPLEQIIGPAPLAAHTKVRSKGRGATYSHSTSAMDSHFASNYNPANDAHPDADIEEDDWDQALEALRDRQKWQQQGAERLKAAGFGEEEIEAWSKGMRKGNIAIEKSEEDVKWARSGEAREWDRGKRVTEQGVETTAEWGRLK